MQPPYQHPNPSPTMAKHAYLIMAHADQPLLETLLEMLDDARNDIYLHADRKWHAFDATRLVVEHASLHILEERIDVAWGHSSMIDAELALFARAAQGGEYAYYHLLSGADLPIKSQDYIHHFFDTLGGLQVVSVWGRDDQVWDARYKVDRYHYGMRYERGLPYLLSVLLAKCRLFCADLLYRLLGPRPIEGEVRKGANWVSLTDDCVRYLLAHRPYLTHRYRHTRNADEIFVQTLLWNSPYRTRLYLAGATDMRYTDWPEGGNSPRVLTLADSERLLASDKLFARKFASSVDLAVIRWLRELLASGSPPPSSQA